MTVSLWRQFGLALGISLGSVFPASAQSCPPNAIELSRQVVGNKLALRCACNPGFVNHDKKCVTIDEAANGFYLGEVDVVALIYAGYIEGEELRKAAANDRWSLKGKAAAFLAALMGEGGQPTVMDTVINMVGPDAENDPAVMAARRKIAERRQAEEQVFLLLRPDIRRPMQELAISHMTNKAKVDFVFGVTAYRLGDYDTSMRLLNSAQAAMPADHSLDQARVIVRMSQRSQWERHHPQAARIQYARAFRSAGAQAAQQLGLQLLASGDYAGGERELRETVQRLRRLNGYADEIDVNSRLADRARDDRAAGKTSTMTERTGERPFDRLSKAELMLTACEYGQKDWGRSLHFLEIAKAADPTNRTLAQAYNELKEIAASAH